MSSPSKATTGGEAKKTKIVKEGSVTLHYPMLTRSNYSVWALKMRVNLQAQGVWEAVEDGDVEVRKDRMALAAIYQGVPEDVLLMIAEKDSAKEAWETLKTMHMGAERVRDAKVQTLRSEFEVLRMKDGESVDDFSMRLTSIVTGIRSLGDKVEEITVVKKFLRAVPHRFIQIVTSVEQFGDLKTMSVEEVVGRLKAHEERLRCYDDREEEKHLLLTHEEWVSRQKKIGGADFSSGSSGRGGDSRGRGRGRGGGRGRGRGRGKSQGDTPTKKDKSTVKCYACQKLGHYASECRSKARGEEVNLTRFQEDEPMLMFAELMTPSSYEETNFVGERDAKSGGEPIRTIDPEAELMKAEKEYNSGCPSSSSLGTKSWLMESEEKARLSSSSSVTSSSQIGKRGHQIGLPH